MQIITTPKATKQCEKLSKTEVKKINKKILILENNPQAGKKLSGNLSEVRSLKAWPYRIIYYINQKEKKIFIVSILHRQGAYK